jgi:hypothetical protein
MEGIVHYLLRLSNLQPVQAQGPGRWRRVSGEWDGVEGKRLSEQK